jgi:hypothetical protein
MAKKEEELGFVKTFLKWSGIEGVLPSTFPEDKFEDVSDSSSDCDDDDDDNNEEKEEEDTKIRKVDFEDFCEKYHKWMPVSIGTFLKRCKKMGKKLIIERKIEFVIIKQEKREEEEYQEFSVRPQKVKLLKSLLNKDDRLSKYKGKKVCLMKIVLRSYEISYPLKINFRVIVRTSSTIEDTAISTFSKTINLSKQADIDVVFSATDKSKIDEQFIKCAFAKEDVLSFIKSGPSKKTPKKTTTIFPFHGNKKIHKNSFVSVWLLRNRYVEWDNGNSVSLYLAPAVTKKKSKKKIKEKKTIVRFEVDPTPEQEISEPVDNSYITIDASAYKPLKKNIGEFLKKLPYVNNNAGSIEIIIDSIMKPKKKERQQQEKKEKIEFKFSMRLEFLVQTDKSIDGREFPTFVTD